LKAHSLAALHCLIVSFETRGFGDEINKDGYIYLDKKEKNHPNHKILDWLRVSGYGKNINYLVITF